MNGGTLPDGAQLLLDISHWMAVAAPYMALVIAAGFIAACGISWRRALLVRDALAGRVRVETVPTSTFDPGEGEVRRWSYRSSHLALQGDSDSALDQGPARRQTALHEISGQSHQAADRKVPMSADLPFFRYHPDPLASGSIRASTETCACCKANRGWIYTATFYTAQDVSGRFCPWCIADGSAAERFAGDFTDSYGLDGVSEDVLHEVTRRTPGFHVWQDPRWLVHCQDAAAFVGEVGYAELAAHPEALDQLRTDMRLDGWHDESRLEHFLTSLGEGATAMLFRCTDCGAHLAYTDAS